MRKLVEVIGLAIGASTLAVFGGVDLLGFVMWVTR